MEILFLDKNLVIVNKPVGVPSEADPSGDADAMALTSADLKARGQGERLYLLHRLDRTVGGLLAFARNPKAAAAYSRYIAEGMMEKTYFAVTDSDPGEGGRMEDILYKDAKQGKAFVIDKMRRGAKEASLTFTKLAAAEVDGVTYYLSSVRLETGRFHQIRVQFASRKCPLVGDGKYGSRSRVCHTPALFSASLAFPSGIRQNALPSEDFAPFCYFKKEDFRL